MRFGICHHRDGVFVEIVPCGIGYSFAGLARELRRQGHGWREIARMIWKAA